MRPFLVPALAALALLATGPTRAQTRPTGTEQDFDRLAADRAYRLGLQQELLHNDEAARRHFQKATALAPDVGDYRQSLARTKQRIAIGKARQGAAPKNLIPPPGPAHAPR